MAEKMEVYINTVALKVLETLPNGDVKVQEINNPDNNWIVPKDTFKKNYQKFNIEFELISKDK